MSVEISPGMIVLGLFNLLLLCLAFFVRQWMARQQAEIDSVKSKQTALTSEFHAYQLSSAMSFAQKAELNDGKRELLDALGSINTKIDRITDKLDKKADKP
jgi:Tfp pilus assembly protein PilO